MEKLWSERFSEKCLSLWKQWTDDGLFSKNTGHAARKESPAAPPGRKAPKPYRESPIPDDWKRQVLTDVPVYPPFRQGLPLLPVSMIIASQSGLIREIYGATGVNQDLWKRLYLPVIHSYAHYVHLLPASEGNHHRGAGGLFRHGLEASLYAVRLTDGQDSLEKSAHMLHPTERRRNEDALRLATFCAGLLHDIGKPLVDMQVFDQQQGTLWNPSLYPSLYQWGQENQVQHYNLRWRTGRMNRHKNIGIATAPHLLNRDVLAFLSDVDAYWVETVLRAISGDEMGVNKVRDFATYGDRESVRYDLKNQGGEGNDIGIPVERYLLDAMRNLIRDGSWTVNKSGAVVWTTAIPKEAVERAIAPETSVIALIWPKAATDIVGWLHQQGTPGIPKDPQVVADMLLDRDIAVPSRDETEGQQRIALWFLAPESRDGVGGPDTAGQRVLVLRHPEYLLDVIPPLSERALYSVKSAATPSAPTSASTASSGLSKEPGKSTDTPPSASPAQTTPSSTAKSNRTGQVVSPQPPQSMPHRDNHVPASPTRDAPTNASTHSSVTQAVVDPALSTHTPMGPSAETEKPANKTEKPRNTTASSQESISMGLRILRTIIREILMQRRDAAILIPAGEESYLKFPEAFKEMGMKPIEMLSMLNDEHLLLPSPESPEKLTQKKTLPGQNKEQTVVVLSPLALSKIPCLTMQLSLFPEDRQAAYQRHLVEVATQCAEAKYSVDKQNNQGYWFLPLEWAMDHLRQQFADDPCPDRFLRKCTIGPGADGGGLFLRLPSNAG